jgi:hypothetical protein
MASLKTAGGGGYPQNNVEEKKSGLKAVIASFFCKKCSARAFPQKGFVVFCFNLLAEKHPKLWGGGGI